MLIEKIEDLQKAVADKKAGFTVTGAAYDLCAVVLRDQTSATGNDWSIVTTNGWMAIVTTFNHSIHRHFMKQEKRDREDLSHAINKNYIIRKTDQTNEYKLKLRK